MAKVDTSLVAHLPLFSGVKPEDLEEILREARSARYPRNTAIFEQGADAQSFFLLLHGHVRAAKTTPTGEQIVVRYVAPGETFGLAMAIGAAHYPATAMAVDDSVVLIWPNSAWPRLIERFPAIAANTLQTVGARLQESHTRILEMSTQQVEQRVAHALLRLAKQSGKKLDHGIEIDFPISRQDIAQMTGTTLHTVSRILSGWESQGLVESGRQRIILRDPHKIVVLAERTADGEFSREDRVRGASAYGASLPSPGIRARPARTPTRLTPARIRTAQRGICRDRCHARGRRLPRYGRSRSDSRRRPS